MTARAGGGGANRGGGSRYDSGSVRARHWGSRAQVAAGESGLAGGGKGMK